MAKEPVRRKRSMFAAVAKKLRQSEFVEVSARENRAFPTMLVGNGPLGGKPKPDWPAKLKAAGMSITEFAELTGTPISTAYDWSRGHTPTPGWVGQVAWLLNDKEIGQASMKALRRSPLSLKRNRP